jgi:hypothetical protein
MAERVILALKYVRLDTVKLWDRNPKEHDIGALVDSIRKHGFRGGVIYDSALNGGLGGIVAGNGRAEALFMMMQAGEPVPLGVDVGEDGMWLMPIQFGLDSKSEAMAEAFGIDANNLTLAGSNLTALDMSQMYDTDGYIALLRELLSEGVELASVTGDDLDLIERIREMDAKGEPVSVGGESGMEGGPPADSDEDDTMVRFVFGAIKADVGRDFYEAFHSTWVRMGSIEEVLSMVSGK